MLSFPLVEEWRHSKAGSEFHLFNSFLLRWIWLWIYIELSWTRKTVARGISSVKIETRMVHTFYKIISVNTVGWVWLRVENTCMDETSWTLSRFFCYFELHWTDRSEEVVQEDIWFVTPKISFYNICNICVTDWDFCELFPDTSRVCYRCSMY